MKTIEPNSDEDLLNQYLVTGIEATEFCRRTEHDNSHAVMAVLATYQNVLRFLEKNIKERGLIN